MICRRCRWSATLTVARTARYQQLGEPTVRTRRVWFVIHGYGQLAAYFIRHYAFLTEVDPSTVVIAPEGLSRFYLSGNSGRVGASWMTRDDRQHEINDHINFLNQLAETLLAASPPDVQVTVLGFSQGTATASRWLAQAPFRPTHLILWAGAFPHDMALATARHLLQNLRLTVVIGTEDEYISADSLARHLEQLRQLGSLPTVISFVGKHLLNRAVLEKLAAQPLPERD